MLPTEKVLICLIAVVSAASAQKQHIVLTDPAPKSMPSELHKHLIAGKPVVPAPSDARELIRAAIEANYFGGDRRPHWTAEDVDSADFYCLIHVLRWKTAAANASSQEVEAQNWYVYNGDKKWAKDDFDTNNRLFGTKNVALLYVHLNRSPDITYEVRHDLEVAAKLPANVQNLLGLAAAFRRTGGIVAASLAPADIFGITDANISYVPSDISATAFISQEGQGQGLTPLGTSVVFDNEGRYWWDVSVAVPIRKMSELEFVNTDNTVVAREADKRSTFAVLDLYPWKRDIKNPGFSWIPYGLVGVGIAKQPLHKILLAAGWGPRFAQFYAGVLFAKQQELTGLSEGSTATPEQQAGSTRMRFKPQFAFGINLPVREVFKAAQ